MSAIEAKPVHLDGQVAAKDPNRILGLFAGDSEAEAALDSVNNTVVWSYPTEESLIVVSIDHVRCIDDIRIRFDFAAHEWVAEMEELGFFDTEFSSPSGIWVEVARWSGNAPRSTRPGPGENQVQMGT